MRETTPVREAKKRKKKNGLSHFFGGVGWFFAFLLSTLLLLLITLYCLMWMFCKGPSPSARNTFVATMLETGNLKFVVSWYLTEEEILSITNRNPSANFIEQEPTDTSLVSINAVVSSNEITMDNDITLVPITGRTFAAQLLIIKDPSSVILATAFPWSSFEMEKNGMTVGEYCDTFGGIAAVNAGEFETPSGINWGGRPIGVVVCDGEIQFNEPTAGDVMVGFNEHHILIIQEIGSMSPEQFSTYVTDNAIIDAVSFKDLSDGNTNHFTKLIMNGTPVELNGKGVGANPRTAIGQCADGTILILVTDGRGTAGHLGATGEDLINIMTEYGAVNAANLDGGSSSSLYFEGSYQITSSFLPNSDASRRLPTAFVIMGQTGGAQ